MDNRKKKHKIILCAILYVLGSILLIHLTGLLHSLLSGNGANINYWQSLSGLWENSTQRTLFLLFNVLLLTACVYMAIANFQIYKSSVTKVAEDIYIPVADGQYQHGSARFSTKKEVNTIFGVEYVDPSNPVFRQMLCDGEAEKVVLIKEAIVRQELFPPPKESKNGSKNEEDIVPKVQGEIVSDLPKNTEDKAILIRDLSIEEEEESCRGRPFSPAEYDRMKDREYSQEIDIDPDAIAANYEDIIDRQYDDENAQSELDFIRNTVLQQELPSKSFQPQFKKGGLVVGMEKHGMIEKWYLQTSDTHILVVGATRSGKSRSLVIQSIFAMAMAGESLVITDPKGELFQYTADFLKDECGYNVACVDFRNPPKSDRYNLLQPTIDAINRGDIEKAEESAWDLTNILVGDDSHGEKIWENGEKAIIAAAILSVVYDNRKRPEYQNLTNVYWFVAEMAKEVQVGTRMVSPLEEYAKAQSTDHPARATFAIADVAPGRTKGSFYTSALTTLKLFNMRYIFGITHTTDIDIAKVGNSKTALFLILPDERTTYYPIASLIISQLYEMLVRQSDERGGRLLNRVNFLCDEFGNFTKLTDFTNKLTVGGGRGIRFHLFLQSLAQLEQKYDKETAAIIKANCETWVYLKTGDNETHKEISEKMGKYTTSAYQISANHSKYTNPQSSHSISLMERDLLTTNEVGRMKRPEQLVIVRGLPSILRADDLSKWHLNTMLAMGDENHNTNLRISKEERRGKRVLADQIPLWGIWDDMRKVLEDWHQLYIKNNGKILPSEYALIKKRLLWAATGVSAAQQKEDTRAHMRRIMEEKRILAAQQKQLQLQKELAAQLNQL